MKIKLTTLLVALSIMSTCYSQKTGTKSSDMETKMKTSKMEKTSTIMKTTEMDKTHTIELKKGELLILAIADQKEGKEQLLQEYLGTIMPSAMKNGFTPLGQLHIDQIVKADNFTPNNFIGFFKWPNMTSIQAFMSDFTPEQLKKLRMPIWNEFKANLIALQEDKSLVINESKLYEVKTLWAKEMISTKSIIENGGKIILDQPIAGYEDLIGNEAPNHMLIIEWNDKKTADAFKKMNTLKPKKEEAFYTHFTLFQ